MGFAFRTPVTHPTFDCSRSEVFEDHRNAIDRPPHCHGTLSPCPALTSRNSLVEVQGSASIGQTACGASLQRHAKSNHLTGSGTLPHSALLGTAFRSRIQSVERVGRGSRAGESTYSPSFAPSTNFHRSPSTSYGRRASLRDEQCVLHSRSSAPARRAHRRCLHDRIHPGVRCLRTPKKWSAVH